GTADWMLVSASANPDVNPPIVVPERARVLDPGPWCSCEILPGAKWVGFEQVATEGEYTYELTFELCCSFSNPQWAMQIRADNRATILLNGTQIEPSVGEGTSIPGSAPVTVSLTRYAGLLRAGSNSLVVKVYNKAPEKAGEKNSVGLMVSGHLKVADGK